jgi:hypothetical protein
VRVPIESANAFSAIEPRGVDPHGVKVALVLTTALRVARSLNDEVRAQVGTTPAGPPNSALPTTLPDALSTTSMKDPGTTPETITCVAPFRTGHGRTGTRAGAAPETTVLVVETALPGSVAVIVNT